MWISVSVSVTRWQQGNKKQKGGVGMKQRLFESDKAFAERVKEEAAAKMGVKKGLF